MVQNMIKLAVGVDSVDNLHERQMSRLFDYHGVRATIGWTRCKPREDALLVESGSIYWVISNHILVRQKILGFEPEDESASSWVIVLDPELTQPVAVPRKAFQGWRYLPRDQAPPDAGPFVPGEREGTLSREMETALRATGLF